ncbi:MAG: hypothetical protein E7Z64_04815 [Thermoplasmata archaeon]|nr:hypothetical protein [Thermoplasmata archaeon]
MIPHRNLDAPDEKDIYMTEENRKYLAKVIEKELGALFWTSAWKGRVEQPIVDYLAERMAEDKEILASDSRDAVRRMAESILEDAIAEADLCIDYYRNKFPWELLEKCLRDEQFSDRDLQGPRNKVSQWLHTGIEEPFLKSELPMVVMAAMNTIESYERKNPPKKRKGVDLQKDVLIDYLLIDYRIHSGHYRFTYNHAMMEIIPDLVEKLVPKMKECGICNTNLV